MKMHESLTTERIMAAAEDSMFGLENPGFCVACGEDAYGVEPDAHGFTCCACGARAVYGAEELLLYLA